MVRLIPITLLTVTLLASNLLFAAEPSPRATAPTRNPDQPALPASLAAPKVEVAAPAAPPRSRPVSSGVAAMLQTRVPAYDPQIAKAAAEAKEKAANGDGGAEAGTSQFAREQPANGIVRLPQLTVRDRVPPIFKETVIYTQKGLRELAYRRYITSEVDRALNRFTIPLFGISAYDRAMMMYREDERLRNMADTADMARIVSLTDPEAGMYVKKVSDKTYMRSSDFGWNASKSSNDR